MSEVRLSTQAGLKMILQCLPESPFRDTASQIIGEAVAKLDEQEDLIVDLNKKVEELEGCAWNSLSEAQKDKALSETPDSSP